MTGKYLALVFVLILSICTMVLAVRSPVGPGTVPPSSRGGGLHRTPNPIDSSGNLVVTGNIGGGRHFRGVVPYRVDSAFGGSLGSSVIDPFLRNTTGLQSMGRYSGSFKPYYSQTRTVTTTAIGKPLILRPPTMKLGGRVADTYGLSPLPRSVPLGT